MNLNYSLYVKSPKELGWKAGSDGSVAGTIGMSLTTDAFRMNCPEIIPEYRIHVQDLGWLDFVGDSQITSGVGRRLEAIQFQNIQYNSDLRLFGRVHVQNLGWCQPKLIREGTVLGTTGHSLRLEAVQFLLAPIQNSDEGEIEQALEASYRSLDGVPRDQINAPVITSRLLALGIGGQLIVGVTGSLIAAFIVEATKYTADKIIENNRIRDAREREARERTFWQEVNQPGWIDLPGHDPDRLVG